MKNDKNISQSVINRLPRYYRFLNRLLENGITRISSAELSKIMMVTASQIRQDLNCFGGFGQQGYGYNVEALRREIGEILGINDISTAILIGAGNLGKAVANRHDLLRKGFKLIGAFDSSTSVIGTTLAGIQVEDVKKLEEFCLREKPVMAIVCVPASAAEEIGKILNNCGVKGIWNFSSYDFTHDFTNLKIVNVHLSDSIMTLSYLLKHDVENCGD